MNTPLSKSFDLISRRVKTATGNLVRYLKSDLLPKLKKIRISKWIIPEPVREPTWQTVNDHDDFIDLVPSSKGSERMDNKKGKNYMKQLFMAIK